MADEITCAVIMDTGSGYCKGGLAGDDAPKTCFPTAIGKSKSDGEQEKESFVGNDALEKRGILNISRPIQRGFVKDWEDLEQIWHHCYSKELKADTSEHPILCGIYPDEQKFYKEKMASVFFETFNVPGFYCSIHALLAMYGSGRTSGLVIDSGEDVTTIVPIENGYTLNYAHTMIPIGGSDLNTNLQKLLKKKNVDLNVEEARLIKHKKGNVATDYQKELEDALKGNSQPSTYELPDGTQIELVDEMLRMSEIMFKPSLIGKYVPGIHELVVDSLQKLEQESKKELVSNLILSGGNTLTEGFQKRLNNELMMMLPTNYKIKMPATNDRQYLSWIGGAVVSALSTFQSMWITKQEYDENGPSIVHTKCL